MLVLSRRPGESLLIGDDIEVVILGFDGRYARVGIRAPKHVPILRKERLDLAARNTAALALPQADRLQESLRNVERVLNSRAAAPARNSLP